VPVDRQKVRTIHLVPVQKIERDLLIYLSRQIEKTFSFPVKIESALPNPDSAYNKSRNQYRSDLILVELQKPRLAGTEKILGLVDLDLYTSRLNFVFGQASMGGRVALVALPRLRQEFYGLPKDQELYYSRVVKEAVHELGHTFGMGHCKRKECVMHFSNSLADADYKRKGLCEDCMDNLKRNDEERYGMFLS